MELEFNRLKKSLLETGLTDQILVQQIKKLQQNFTSNRLEIQDYLSDPKMVSAYTALYLTTNLQKFEFLMNLLSEEQKEKFEKYDFIDFGMGPGTYSLAHYLYFPNSISQYFGIDQSSLMIEQAQKVFSSFGINDQRVTILKALEIEQVNERKSKKVLFFGNSFNEMENLEFEKIISLLEPELLVLLEPGTKASFKKVFEVRDFLISSQYQCLYPCSHIHLKCPLTADDWCHQVLRVTHGPEVQRLCQLAKIDRNSMPLIAHVYQKKGVPFKKNLDSQVLSGVTVRILPETKFSFRQLVCMDENDYRGLFEVEILKKRFDKQDLKKLKKKSTGERIIFTLEKVISKSILRIILLDLGI